MLLRMRNPGVWLFGSLQISNSAGDGHRNSIVWARQTCFWRLLPKNESSFAAATLKAICESNSSERLSRRQSLDFALAYLSFTSDSPVRHLAGDGGGTRALAADAAAARVLRREYAHLFCRALRTALVQSVERKVVRRLLANYLSTADAPVDRAVLAHHGAEIRLHAGAVHRRAAAAHRHVSLRRAVGG